MAGSTTYTPQPISLARTSDTLAVFRYDPTGVTKWTLLPNIRCLGITTREGADPGSARFRYTFGDPLGSSLDPARFEQVFPLDAIGPRVVNTDDQVVVVAIREDGSHSMLHWGFVQVPQADLGPDAETVSFVSLGAAIREWDTPLPGAYVRDADSPLIVSDTQTDMPARFNPDGHPNASPKDGDAGTAPAEYPVFLGPNWPSNAIAGEAVRPWTLAMAARYIIVRGTTATDAQGRTVRSKYVTYSSLDYLDDLLTAIRPVDPADDGPVDEDDDATFELEDIEAPDVDVTGQCWPAALWRLIEPHGFGMRFDLSEGTPSGGGYPGDPTLTLRLYWKDGERPAKTLSLQEPGATLDPGKTNLQELSLARDIAGIANRIVIDAAPIRVESAFLLAPAFVPDAADLTNVDAFREGNANFTGVNRDKYRLWVFDEAGAGHWNFKDPSAPLGAQVDGIATDLTPAFALGKKTRYWSIRNRKPLSTLVSVGEKGRPLNASLFVSFDYQGGPIPGIFKGDSNAHWQEVTSGEWRLLDDRIGVYLTATDVNSWAYFKPDALTSSIFAEGKLSMVERCANSTFLKPIFMLVCSVDTDNDFDVSAEKRQSSPTQFTITRRAEARDRFRKTVVSKWSWYAEDADFGATDRTVADDEDEAQALADAQRRHSESGTFAGSATIPRITTAYQLGDKITEIVGRGVSLRSNVGAEQGESPVYPSVVGVSWHFDGSQGTSLELSDARAEPPPRRGKRRGE